MQVLLINRTGADIIVLRLTGRYIDVWGFGCSSMQSACINAKWNICFRGFFCSPENHAEMITIYDKLMQLG